MSYYDQYNGCLCQVRTAGLRFLAQEGLSLEEENAGPFYLLICLQTLHPLKNGLGCLTMELADFAHMSELATDTLSQTRSCCPSYYLSLSYIQPPLNSQHYLPSGQLIYKDASLIQIRNKWKMHPTDWYLSLYYKYRQYPVQHLTQTFKNNELKQIYSQIFHRLSTYFYIDPKISEVSSQRISSECTKKMGTSSHLGGRDESSFQFLTATHLNTTHPLLMSMPKTFRDSEVFLSDRKKRSIRLSLEIAVNLSEQVLYLLLQKKLKAKTSTPQTIKRAHSQETTTRRLMQSEASSIDLSTILDINSEININVDEQKGKSEQQLGQITVGKIPKDTEQISYFFMQFCSNIDVNPQTDKILNSSIEESYTDSHQSQLSAESLQSQFQAAHKKKQKQFISSDFDNFLLSVSNEELKKTNQILKDKVFNFQEMGELGINMLLETWLQIILMRENDDKICFRIVEQLIQDQSNPQRNKFTQKVSSYLHFITRMQTKKLFAESMTKLNFITLIPQILSDSRSLTSLKLQRNGGFIEVSDLDSGKQIQCDNQGLKHLWKKWKVIGSITSEILCKDNEVFWAQIFHESIQLLDILLMEVLEFSYSILLLREKMKKHERLLQQSVNQEFVYILESILIEQISEFWAREDVEQESNREIKRRLPLTRDTLGNTTNSYFFDHQFHGFLFSKQRKGSGQVRVNPQLREWEATIHQSIKKLRNYRTILDTGLKAFSGQPECTAVFFIQSYRSFRHLQILTQETKSVETKQYCQFMIRLIRSIEDKMGQREELQGLRSKLSQDQKQCQLLTPGEFGTKANWMRNKSSNEMSSEKDLKHSALVIQFQAQKQYFTALSAKIMSKVHKAAAQKKKEEQLEGKSEDSHSETSLSQDDQFSINLEILGFAPFQNMLLRSKNVKANSNNCLSHYETKIFEHINEHLRLVNLCNFAYNWEEIRSQSTKSISIKKPIFFTTKELVKDLEYIKKQQKLYQNKKVSQAKARRTNSNAMKSFKSSFIRQDRITLNLNSQLKSSNLKRRSSIDMTIPKVELSHIVCEKMIIKIGEHNKVLESLLISNYKQNLFQAHVQAILSSKYAGWAQSQEKQSMELAEHYINFYKKGNSFKNKSEDAISQSENKSRIQEFVDFLQAKVQAYNLREELLLLTVFNSSLEIDVNTFNSIQSTHLLSAERMSKIAVFAKQYFNSTDKKVQSLAKIEGVENYYLLEILPVIISLMELNYERGEHPLVKSIGATLNKYFFYYTQQIQLRETVKPHQTEDMANLKRILGEIFEWNNSFEDMETYNVYHLLQDVLNFRSHPQSDIFVADLRSYLQHEKQSLQLYSSERQKIEYLQYKMLYLVMRELYFNFKYDVTLFEEKNLQAKSNYKIYEQKILEFFEGITQRDEEEFKLKKSEELKQRSAFLQGYLLNYEKQPEKPEQLRGLIKKVVSIFDNFLSVLTEKRRTEMKKRGRNNPGLQTQNKAGTPLYLHFVGTEYIRSNGSRTRVFDVPSFSFYRAIEIYERMLDKTSSYGERKCSDYKVNGGFQAQVLGLSAEQSQFLEGNLEILGALWINSEEKVIHEQKMGLIRNTFLSKIEKLYMDLDVRHKVFEVFKDKILNYEMQKSKIYHQYMDYIRGLKLDVYSHVAGEDPLPYFKLINAIKIYRMGIKKEELDEKVHQQFGKNLRKWNQGIQGDLDEYHLKVEAEENYWAEVIHVCQKNKRQLMEIHSIIEKELKRQFNKQTVHNHKQNKQKNRPNAAVKRVPSGSIKVRMVLPHKSVHR